MIALIKISLFDSKSTGRDYLLNLQIYIEFPFLNQSVNNWKDQVPVRSCKSVQQILVP